MSRATLFYRFCRAGLCVLYRLFWRLEVRGREHIPADGGLIVAANHRSYGDPPLVSVAMTRPLHFLAKQELFTFAPFAWLITALNAHPLNREGDIAAIRAARKVLKEGDCLIIFPEGTRSRTDELGAARAGVGLLASMSGAPILPVYLHNSGYMKAFRKVTIEFGRPFRAADLGPDASHQQIAEETLRRIAGIRGRYLP